MSMIKLVLVLAIFLSHLCKNALVKKAKLLQFILQSIFFSKFLFQKSTKTIYISTKAQLHATASFAKILAIHHRCTSKLIELLGMVILNMSKGSLR